MKFIIVDNRSGKHRSFNAGGLLVGLTVASLVGLPCLSAYLAWRHGAGEAALTSEMISKWQDVLEKQQQEVDIARREAQDNIEASAVRIAKLQARIVRLDALGERLTSVANLDEGEFDFSQPVGVGGPEIPDSTSDYEVPNPVELLDTLSADIADREQQLSVLETLLFDQKMQSDVFIAGRPVRKGWLSSRFGKRTDPITGKPGWHNGVDFAGAEGAEVITVAAGVVVFAGQRSGYGQMVEVNHGGGYATRYGHHKELHVKAGDVVKKGQLIGSMGSSGRSTGPHVHFEVFKNGRVVDPSAYIHRASR